MNARLVIGRESTVHVGGEELRFTVGGAGDGDHRRIADLVMMQAGWARTGSWTEDGNEWAADVARINGREN